MLFLLKYWKPLAILALLACAYFTGRIQQHQSDEKSHTAAILKQTQEARAKEQLAAIEQNRITDALLQKNAATASERDAVSERLRKLSASRSAFAASCARSDEAPAALISDERREAFLSEARRANEVVNQLTAAQEAIVSLQKACSPTGRSLGTSGSQ